MKPNYRPRTLQQKLGWLIEECEEVLAAVGKTLRWGLHSVNPELPPEEQETNVAWILRELKDLEKAQALARTELYERQFRGDRSSVTELPPLDPPALYLENLRLKTFITEHLGDLPKVSVEEGQRLVEQTPAVQRLIRAAARAGELIPADELEEHAEAQEAKNQDTDR